LLRKFEEFLKGDDKVYFELENFEKIIEYYLDTEKYSKALKASKLGLDQYPFSAVLMLDHAHALCNLEQYQKALKVLENANNLQPNDPDIY